MTKSYPQLWVCQVGGELAATPQRIRALIKFG
jgi:hypothetical protein